MAIAQHQGIARPRVGEKRPPMGAVGRCPSRKRHGRGETSC